MEFPLSELLPFANIITLLIFACTALVADLFMQKRYPHLSYYIALVGIVVALGLTVNSTISQTALLQGQAIQDGVGQFLQVFVLVSVLGALVYGRHYVLERKIMQGEYYVLATLSTLGMLVLVSAHSLLTLYLGVEIMSLPLYAMVALRKEHAASVEASLKYFIMGAIASAMLLYGFSLIYGITGHIVLSDIAASLKTVPASQHIILEFALVFIVAAVGFKLAAVPFHMWAPDVYTGAPTSVTIFLSSAPKVAAVAMLMRLMVIAMPSMLPEWRNILIVLSILSMGIGNLLAIAQTNFKRMLAYSAISHAGFILLGFIGGNAEGYAAAIYYIAVYVLMTLGAFGIILLLSKQGFEAEMIEDLRGLNKRNPWLAFMLLLIMFSLAGIPPLVGFFAKLFVLSEVVNVGLTWLAVVALLFAIMGTFYYIRIVKTMYFEDPIETSAMVTASDTRTLFTLNSLMLIVLGLLPAALWTWSQTAVTTLLKG